MHSVAWQNSTAQRIGERTLRIRLSEYRDLLLPFYVFALKHNSHAACWSAYTLYCAYNGIIIVSTFYGQMNAIGNGDRKTSL